MISWARLVLALCCLIIIDARNGIKKWRQIWHQTFMVSSVYWDQAWHQKLFQTNIFKLKKWFMGLIEPVIPYKMPQTRTFFDVLLWFRSFFSYSVTAPSIVQNIKYINAPLIFLNLKYKDLGEGNSLQNATNRNILCWLVLK